MSKRIQRAPRVVVEDANGVVLLDTEQLMTLASWAWDAPNEMMILRLRGLGIGPFVSSESPRDQFRTERAAELAQWWRDQAESEIDMVVEKATEYGGGGNAIDLIDIGRDQARAQGREVDDEEATELGIYFYLRGKLSRWTAAYIEHRRVSDDTIVDINVYGRMAQRNRQRQGWPGRG